jgi:hypothetical protein
LKKAIHDDTVLRNENVVLTWKKSEQPEKVEFLGIESTLEPSAVTSSDYVVWTGKPITQNIPYFRINQPGLSVKCPKAYWVPATYKDVIERLTMHGIQMEKIMEPTTVEVEMYRVEDHKMSQDPFEGHFIVTATTKTEKHTETFYPGSVRIPMDQKLGDLLMYLLEPASPDSFFSWGFFMEIFSRTEYIEEYAIEPIARQMLAKDEKLQAEFQLKKREDPKFFDDKAAVYRWFYERSPYYDNRYLLYPVGREE